MADNEANFRRFKLEMDRFWEQEAPEAVAVATQKMAIQGLRGVVLRTPVDTGRARGNWQVGVGSEPGGVLDVEDKPGGETIGRGTGVIVAAQPYRVIYLTNNLLYILKLEDGSSKQAPAGMVGVTLAELQSQFAVIP